MAEDQDSTAQAPPDSTAQAPPDSTAQAPPDSTAQAPPPGTYATLGRVPTPQAVPAKPGQYIEAPAEVSPVTAATVARLLGKE